MFVCGYGLALGLWGLFAWPRRHAVAVALLSLVMIAFLIVNIILAACDVGLCLPSDGHRPRNLVQVRNLGHFQFNGRNDNNYFRRVDRWCGSNILVYITHGILIGLFVSISLYPHLFAHST